MDNNWTSESMPRWLAVKEIVTGRRAARPAPANGERKGGGVGVGAGPQDRRCMPSGTTLDARTRGEVREKLGTKVPSGPQWSPKRKLRGDKCGIRGCSSESK